MKKNEMDIGRLREIFYCDPADGVLRYRVARAAEKVGAAAGYINVSGYRIVMVDYKAFSAHRVVWALVTGEWPEFPLDHRDLNKDNNGFANLRLASGTLNSANTRVRREGKKGVSKRRNKFLAHIKKDGQQYHLGVFDTEDDAHAAYCKKAVEFFGEYARFE